jgi:hypothetical protein
VLEARVPGGLSEPVQHELTNRIRAQIGAISAEMTKEIQAQIPEYARPLDPVYVRTVGLAVQEALHHFLDVLERRSPSEDGWRELFRAIGAGEQREGRSLEPLQSAMRVCARLGWRWLVDFAEAENVSLGTLGKLAEIIFSFLDQLADASAAGYAQAKAAEAGEMDRRRRRLLELLLADPPVSAETIAAAAQAAHWQVPKRLAAVAVEPRSALAEPPLLASDILASFERPEPCLIVPDPDQPGRVRALTTGLAGVRAAVGPELDPTEALKSFRWARETLSLARRGLLPGTGSLVWCRDHLATLAVFRDENLLGVLAERRLAPLAGLRDGQRQLLTETLLVWLSLDKSATDTAVALHVHPQTVRYRLRQLDRLFGPALRDPRLRFEFEVALRYLAGTDK